jgi:hypothetical protein
MNWPVVTDEPVEFEKHLVDIQDLKNFTNRLRGTYGTDLKLIEKNRKISMCNWLDLETLGSWPIMPKTLSWTLVITSRKRIKQIDSRRSLNKIVELSTCFWCTVDDRVWWKDCVCYTCLQGYGIQNSNTLLCANIVTCKYQISSMDGMVLLWSLSLIGPSQKWTQAHVATD